jgi:hypothetical protein
MIFDKEDDVLFSDAVYIGIDPTAGERPMQYAALDADLGILSLDKGDLETVMAFVAGQVGAFVAIAAPKSPNQGLLQQSEIRRRYNLRPGSKTWGQWRVCEYELRRRNVRLYNTPNAAEAAPGWIKTSFLLFKRLGKMGYSTYIHGEQVEPRILIEVNPHACFATLLERRPMLKRTLEGRLQRQLVLYLEGLDVSNPMHALEEITRHHLLTGHLPLEGLHDQEELYALVAAYTAYLVALKPERICQVGDKGEGLITLPVPDLREHYI